jgi:hypothetical protein
MRQVVAVYVRVGFAIGSINTLRVWENVNLREPS